MKKNKLREQYQKRTATFVNPDFGVHSHFFGKAVGETGIFDYVEFLAE